MNAQYIPKPLDTNHIELSDDLHELTELLSKNTHEVWAKQRLTDGWTYGAETNDDLKKHPCLVPYEELPEYEKEYDRNTAMEALRVICKLGFNISKK
jgi:ryanodine receptor 2